MPYWINPSTGNYYGYEKLSKISKTVLKRGLQTYVLFSPNVLETARKYYNCPTMEGMQLENEVNYYLCTKVYFYLKRETVALLGLSGIRF